MIVRIALAIGRPVEEVRQYEPRLLATILEELADDV